jgi:hypothetical protein
LVAGEAETLRRLAIKANLKRDIAFRIKTGKVLSSIYPEKQCRSFFGGRSPPVKAPLLLKVRLLAVTKTHVLGLDQRSQLLLIEQAAEGTIRVE